MELQFINTLYSVIEYDRSMELLYWKKWFQVILPTVASESYLYGTNFGYFLLFTDHTVKFTSLGLQSFFINIVFFGGEPQHAYDFSDLLCEQMLEKIYCYGYGFLFCYVLAVLVIFHSKMYNWARLTVGGWRFSKIL